MGLANEPAGVDARITRRTIVAAGAKLAYGTPLVAASFRLSGRDVHAEDYCETCILDELSPKPLSGGCYTCKAAEAGCVNTRSNAQAASVNGTLVCVCQGNPKSNGKSKCIINGTEYGPGQVIDDGICHPVNVIGDPDYDTCVGSVSPV